MRNRHFDRPPPAGGTPRRSRSLRCVHAHARAYSHVQLNYAQLNYALAYSRARTSRCTPRGRRAPLRARLASRARRTPALPNLRALRVCKRPRTRLCLRLPLRPSALARAAGTAAASRGLRLREGGRELREGVREREREEGGAAGGGKGRGACVCACVCVCERESARARARARDGEWGGGAESVRRLDRVNARKLAAIPRFHCCRRYRSPSPPPWSSSGRDVSFPAPRSSPRPSLQPLRAASPPPSHSSLPPPSPTSSPRGGRGFRLSRAKTATSE